jgi:hypothetical protein
MGVGAGIFLMAVGAILKYAITDNISGVNLDAVGMILIIAGAAVAIISLLLYATASSRRRGDAVVSETYVERDISPPATPRI